ncbi:hypothetical protein [Leuconostoc mesenteroides]|uniref:hypothetical protein n=1 Tax=Leuconostoc mesenteroides TaxID=1245 RepID=UPI00236133E3|nr:hypothetical protein [Leuconostoc mesenteroides]
MRFDEAFEQVEYSIDYCDDNAFDKWCELLNDLRQEYAPTVEMTQTQYDYIAPLIKEGKELGATFTEFWEVYKFIGASKKIDRTFDRQEQAMRAWLHPETIKIVDE